jgi:hypothetical protein
MRTKPHLIRSIIVALLVLNTFVGLTRAQNVTILDAGLNAAIRATLAKPTGPLSVQDLLTLTNLDASNRSISNLAGLEFATNLLSLNLQGNLLSNPAFPTNLTRLNSLDLSQNRFGTFSLPPILTSLVFFDLSFNGLTNVSLPNGLTNLTQLIIQGNNFLPNLTLPQGLTALARLPVFIFSAREGGSFVPLLLSCFEEPSRASGFSVLCDGQLSAPTQKRGNVNTTPRVRVRR